MPGFRRTYRRRPYRRTYRRTRRVGRPRAVTRSMPSVFKMKRSFSTTVDVADVDFFTGTQEFRLNQLPNYTEFTSLFNSYKIYFAKVTFIYDRNDAVSAPAGTNLLPNLLTCIDTNDATGLASLGEFQEYRTYKLRRMDRPITVLLKPKPATAVYYTGASPRYAADGSDQWIDCAGVTVPFYGLKYGFLGGAAGGIGTYTLGHCMINVTLYMKFRDPR